MTTAAQKDWKQDFGLNGRKPPHFFSSVDQLDDVAGRVPQPHALRRAFEQLGIEGILCQERSPVIYFRQVRKIDPEEVTKIHRSFWNQGIAPILVVIAPDEVHVYSGLVPPASLPEGSGRLLDLSRRSTASQDQLRAFMLSVESGEYFHVHRAFVRPASARGPGFAAKPPGSQGRNSATSMPDGSTRQFSMRFFAEWCSHATCSTGASSIGTTSNRFTSKTQVTCEDILAKKPRTDAKADLYKLFGQLVTDFNGDLFSATWRPKAARSRSSTLKSLTDSSTAPTFDQGSKPSGPTISVSSRLRRSARSMSTSSKRRARKQKKEAGAFYTPRFLAELLLGRCLGRRASLAEKRFLDPACGSGIFLVGLFNRLAEEWNLKNPGARYDRRANGLMANSPHQPLRRGQQSQACQITAFSLYLAFLDQLSPPDIRKLLASGSFAFHLVSVPQTRPASSARKGRSVVPIFSRTAANLTHKGNLIVGNPPWGSAKDRNTPVVRWCAERNLPLP